MFTVALGSYFGTRLFGEDRRLFLPGRTTGGHYQLEIACDSCHEPLGGIREEGCIDCHGERLRLSNDTHPKSKFTDPRNAERVARLDARACVACHREHQPESTGPMGLTLPVDYCVLCHENVGTERPSHADLGFETCASAGCHNFHDNTALYEDFLLEHSGEPDVLPTALVPVRRPSSSRPDPPLTARDADPPPGVEARGAILEEWERTTHARAGVNCTGCHGGHAADGAVAWRQRPGHETCAGCHADEAGGWKAGKHGMRAALDLPLMRSALARLPMKPSAADRELGCVACHGSHAFDTRRAAVEACVECHDDGHSLAYRESAHFDLWRKEAAGEAPEGSGVSCATCHLPRRAVRVDGAARIAVEHNQNFNLRPNEKMARDVCMRCHGLGYVLDALADEALIAASFRGSPARHVASIEMAERRAAGADTERSPR